MKKLSLLLLTLFLASSVYARGNRSNNRMEKRSQRATEMFKEIAGDDKAISLEKFKDHSAKMAEERFKEMDKDNNGKVTEDEFTKAGKRRFKNKRKTSKRSKKNA